jgi:hypothetical protein
MTSAKLTSFRELVQSKYLDTGAFTKTASLHKIAAEAGIGRDCAFRAFDGLRVQGKTAESLMLWCAITHHIDLDAFAMTIAPTTPPRSQGDAGKRAEELIEAAVQRAHLPAELACVVQLDLASGMWNVSCRNLMGGPPVDRAAPDLSEALTAVSEAHYAGRHA